MLKFDAKLEFNTSDVIIAGRGLQDGGPVQTYVDERTIAYCDPLVPMDTGTLKNSALLASPIGHGVVIYETNYAKRMYYNPQFNFHGAPDRGAFWVERMKAVHMDDIVRGAAAIAGGKAAK